MKRLLLLGAVVLAVGSAAVACHYAKQREVDDWRHIHTWGKWTSAPMPVNGNLWQTRLCGVCGKFVARKVME